MKLDEPALNTCLTLFLLSLNPTASSSNNCQLRNVSQLSIWALAISWSADTVNVCLCNCFKDAKWACITLRVIIFYMYCNLWDYWRRHTTCNINDSQLARCRNTLTHHYVTTTNGISSTLLQCKGKHVKPFYSILRHFLCVIRTSRIINRWDYHEPTKNK